MKKIAILRWLRLVALLAAVAYGSVAVAGAAAKMMTAIPSAANAPASAPNGHGTQTFMARVGIVVVYDTQGKTITIRDHRNVTYKYTLSSSLVILPSHRADQLKVGAFVTVVAPNNVSGGKQLAVRIIVHPNTPPGFATTVTPTNTPTRTPTHADENTYQYSNEDSYKHAHEYTDQHSDKYSHKHANEYTNPYSDQYANKYTY